MTGNVREAELVTGNVREAELVATSVAARALGVSSRTLERYVERGQVTPALTLPSGRYRWRVAELLAQVARP